MSGNSGSGYSGSGYSESMTYGIPVVETFDFD